MSRKLIQNGKYPTPLSTLITRNLARLQGETCRRIRREATTHLETSLVKTFRVGEGDGEAEEEDTGEEDTNPIVVV